MQTPNSQNTNTQLIHCSMMHYPVEWLFEGHSEEKTANSCIDMQPGFDWSRKITTLLCSLLLDRMTDWSAQRLVVANRPSAVNPYSPNKNLHLSFKSKLKDPQLVRYLKFFYKSQIYVAAWLKNVNPLKRFLHPFLSTLFNLHPNYCLGQKCGTHSVALVHLSQSVFLLPFCFLCPQSISAHFSLASSSDVGARP